MTEIFSSILITGASSGIGAALALARPRGASGPPRATRPLDLVIANAGIGSGTGDGQDATLAIFKTNIGGVLNTLYPALAPMRARGRGTIALMSSLASFRGLPGGAAYGASKAAVRILGEGLRGEYLKDGVKIAVIAPGYVVSPMTDRNSHAMPLLMPAERAAAIIA